MEKVYITVAEETGATCILGASLDIDKAIEIGVDYVLGFLSDDEFDVGEFKRNHSTQIYGDDRLYIEEMELSKKKDDSEK